MTKSFLRAQRLRVSTYTAVHTSLGGLGSSCTASSESAIDLFWEDQSHICVYL